MRKTARAKYGYSGSFHQHHQFGHPTVRLHRITPYNEEDKRNLPDIICYVEFQTDDDHPAAYGGTVEYNLSDYRDASRLLNRIVRRLEKMGYTLGSGEEDKRNQFLEACQACGVAAIVYDYEGLNIVGWHR